MSSKKAPIKVQPKKAAPQKKPARKPAKAPAKKAPKSPQKKSAKKVRVLTPEQRERKNRLARERRVAKRLGQQKKPLKAVKPPKAKTCELKSTSFLNFKKPGKCGGSCGSCGGCGAIRKAFADAPKDRKCCSAPVRMTVEEARQVRDAAAMVAAALDCALEALRDVREASEFERLFDEVSKVVDGNEMA